MNSKREPERSILLPRWGKVGGWRGAQPEDLSHQQPNLLFLFTSLFLWFQYFGGVVVKDREKDSDSFLPATDKEGNADPGKEAWVFHTHKNEFSGKSALFENTLVLFILL